MKILILKCLNDNPNERPSFDEILLTLEEIHLLFEELNKEDLNEGNEYEEYEEKHNFFKVEKAQKESFQSTF